MTGNSSEIKHLKYKQAKKKKKINRYKKRARKHIFLLTLPFITYVMINIDSAFKEYGSVTNFVAAVMAVFVAFVVLYVLIMMYFIRQEEREIKIIRSKIYKLMKLSDD